MDPLAPLLELPEVAPAVSAAVTEVDRAMPRRPGAGLAVEVALRSAVASAALEGHRYDVEQVRAGLVTDPVLQGALRVAGELDRLAPRWTVAPGQVLARLHVLAARGVVEPDALGRPAVASPRLETLMTLVAARGSPAPALVRAAVLHGELLALRAFAGPNGVVARAAGRLTLIAAGLDPRALLPVEVGHLAREPEYVGSAGAFATGTPDGVRSWLRHCAAAASAAATELGLLV